MSFRRLNWALRPVKGASSPELCPGLPPLVRWLVRPAPARNVCLAIALFGIVVGLQFLLGAYSGERGGYPDEAPHVLNGVLLRDYVLTGLGASPMAFAREYYVHYPKIAPLMWPPLFHAAAGLAMLVVPVSPYLVTLWLVAGSTALASWRLARMLEDRVPLPFALVGVFYFLTTSVVLNMTAAVMLDMTVAVFALESAFQFSRFVAEPRARNAVMFALAAAGACLTKGNGLAVILIPPVVIMATRRWRLLTAPSFWLAVVVVGVLAGPLLLYTLSLDNQIGDFQPTTPSFALAKAQMCLGFLVKEFGGPALALAILGSGMAIIRPERNTRADDLPVALLALIIGAIVIHAVTPLRTLDGRYMAMAVAPLCYFMVSGGVELGRLLSRPWVSCIWLGCVTLMLCLSWGGRDSVAAHEPLGAERLVDWLAARGQHSEHTRVLIVSDEKGEGAVVSAFAFRRAALPVMVLRASKLFGQDNWNGHGFSLTYSSVREVIEALDDLQVDAIALDSSIRSPIAEQVSEALRLHPDRYRLTGALDGTRAFALYEPTSPPPEARRPIRVTPSPTGETLESD